MPTDAAAPVHADAATPEARKGDVLATSASIYNPEWKPTGIEGGVDTNKLPWIPVEHAPGMLLKPLRVSDETGFFSCVVKMEPGAAQPDLVHLGAMDFMILSGEMNYPEGPLAGDVSPGTWGYIPANARVKGLRARAEGAEYLANFYGAVAFLTAAGRVAGVLTAADVKAMARRRGVVLCPNTLAACMQPREEQYSGPAEALQISAGDAAALCTRAEGVAADPSKATSPHYVDTRKVPWIVQPEMPDVGLKVLRVSAETGVVSLIVRHNGVAPPHYHLGSSDFMVLSGKIGYRAGPPEGYGAGMWFFEPAGARHEATQRVGDEDLIYLANVYGPIQFDGGVGTPVALVLSWMQYLQQAEAANAPLVRSTFADDAAVLAWAPLTGDGAAPARAAQAETAIAP